MLVPTIGIEVHAELKSKTKAFSNSKNAYDNYPNVNVNEIDLGYPGTLPRINKEVVNMALKAALALNCKINKKMHFDRKNYFYPDLPKGYQITQADTPIGYDGYLEIEVNGNKKKIGIERIHIEEDTCKSIHTMDGTLLNFNRAGVPLIEIVTKPCITSPIEATSYLESLREMLLYLDVSDVKMEEGSMRCEANVSLHEEGTDKLGTKIEIKNIGSISNVAASINYEINRQKDLIENNIEIKEETRRFDDKTSSTILMRVKETGNDYRYFPEPDLPYIYLTDEQIETTRKKLPVLPQELKEKYKNAGMSDVTIKSLINNKTLCMFLENVYDKINPVNGANILTGDVLSYLNKNDVSLNETHLTISKFVELLISLEKNIISSKQAKELIKDLMENDETVNNLINKKGMIQITDESQIKEMINKVLDQNEESIKDYKEGKDRAIKFLMGQIMKESKGKVNPSLASSLLISELNKR